MCFDYDSPEIASSKEVKCRKPHKCGGCRKTIPAGAVAKHDCGKFDGEFYSFYTCESCRRLQMSIAAQEIREGCRWHEAWCSVDDMRDYVAQLSEPLRMLEGTIDECMTQLNELWKQAKEKGVYR